MPSVGGRYCPRRPILVVVAAGFTLAWRVDGAGAVLRAAGSCADGARMGAWAAVCACEKSGMSRAPFFFMGASVRERAESGDVP